MMLAYTDMPLKIITTLQSMGVRQTPNFSAWKWARAFGARNRSVLRPNFGAWKLSTQQKRASDFSGEISAPFVLRSITEQKTSII